MRLHSRLEQLIPHSLQSLSRTSLVTNVFLSKIHSTLFLPGLCDFFPYLHYDPTVLSWKQSWIRAIRNQLPDGCARAINLRSILPTPTRSTLTSLRPTPAGSVYISHDNTSNKPTEANVTAAPDSLKTAKPATISQIIARCVAINLDPRSELRDALVTT